MIWFYRDFLDGALYIVIALLSLIFILAIIGFIMERLQLKKEEQNRIAVLQAEEGSVVVTPTDMDVSREVNTISEPISVSTEASNIVSDVDSGMPKLDTSDVSLESPSVENENIISNPVPVSNVQTIASDESVPSIVTEVETEAIPTIKSDNVSSSIATALNVPKVDEVKDQVEIPVSIVLEQEGEQNIEKEQVEENENSVLVESSNLEIHDQIEKEEQQKDNETSIDINQSSDLLKMNSNENLPFNSIEINEEQAKTE